MSDLTFHWFLPTNGGDGAHVGLATGAVPLGGRVATSSPVAPAAPAPSAREEIPA